MKDAPGSGPLLIVGLGNPGAEYAGTRHNVGFMIVDYLAKKYEIRLRGGKGSYRAGRGEIGGRAVLCAKPLTFMNLSGEAVGDLVRRYAIDPAVNLLVICDDLSLPLGKMRFRKKGSDGGNRGLRSIIDSLASQEFGRLRIGIRSSGMIGDYPDFVLSRFSEEERPLIGDMTVRAAGGIETWVTEGIDSAMNRHNSVASTEE